MKQVPSIVIQAKPITPQRSSNIHVGKSVDTDGNGDLLLMQRMSLLCLFAMSGSETKIADPTPTTSTFQGARGPACRARGSRAGQLGLGSP